MAFFLPTEADAVILRELVEEHKRNKASKRDRGLDLPQDVYQSPDVYLGKLNSGSVLSAFGTGPGIAKATIYRPGGLTGTAAPVLLGLSKNVLNFGASQITGSASAPYFPLLKEKSGKFLSVKGLGGADEIPPLMMTQYNGVLDAANKVPSFPQWVQADGVTNSILNGGSGIDYTDYGVRMKSGTSTPDGVGTGHDLITISNHTAAEVASSLKDHDISLIGTTQTVNITISDHTPAQIANALEDHTGSTKLGFGETQVIPHKGGSIAALLLDHPGTASTGTITGISVGAHTAAEVAGLIKDHPGADIAAALKDHAGLTAGTSTTGVTVGTHAGKDTGNASTGISVTTHPASNTGTSVTGITVGTVGSLTTTVDFTGISVDDHLAGITGTATTGISVNCHTGGEIAGVLDDHLGQATDSNTTGITETSVDGLHDHIISFITTCAQDGTASPYVQDIAGGRTGFDGNHKHTIADPGHDHFVTGYAHSGAGNISHVVIDPAHLHTTPVLTHSVTDSGHCHSVPAHNHPLTDPSHGHTTPSLPHSVIDSGHCHPISEYSHAVTDPGHSHPASGSQGHVGTGMVTHSGSGGPLTHTVSDGGHSHTTPVLTHVGTGQLTYTVLDFAHLHGLNDLSHTGTGGNLIHVASGTVTITPGTGLLMHVGTGSGLPHGTIDTTFKHKKTHYIEKVAP